MSDLTVNASSSSTTNVKSMNQENQEEYLTTDSDEYVENQQSPNSSSGTTIHLNNLYFEIAKIIHTSELLYQFFLEYMSNPKSAITSYMNQYVHQLTQEEIDKIMNDLIDEYMKHGLNDNQMKKSDFKELLHAINEKFGLGLTDEQIEALADEFINCGWFGLNTRDKEQVINFLKQKNLWPTPDRVTNRLTYQQLKEIYSKLDRNKDGNLSWDEAKWVMSKEDFDRLDANKDGYVNYPEICDAQNSTGFIDANQDAIYSKEELEQAVENFDQLDANKDGYLDINELQMSKENFAKFDSNKDGKITKEELQYHNLNYETPEGVHKGWYEKQKREILEIKDPSSASAALKATNIANSINSVSATATSIGQSHNEIKKSVIKQIV